MFKLVEKLVQEIGGHMAAIHGCGANVIDGAYFIQERCPCCCSCLSRKSLVEQYGFGGSQSQRPIGEASCGQSYLRDAAFGDEGSSSEGNFGDGHRIACADLAQIFDVIIKAAWQVNRQDQFVAFKHALLIAKMKICVWNAP